MKRRCGLLGREEILEGRVVSAQRRLGLEGRVHAMSGQTLRLACERENEGSVLYLYLR